MMNNKLIETIENFFEENDVLSKDVFLGMKYALNLIAADDVSADDVDDNVEKIGGITKCNKSSHYFPDFDDTSKSVVIIGGIAPSSCYYENIDGSEIRICDEGMLCFSELKNAHIEAMLPSKDGICGQIVKSKIEDSTVELSYGALFTLDKCSISGNFQCDILKSQSRMYFLNCDFNTDNFIISGNKLDDDNKHNIIFYDCTMSADVLEYLKNKEGVKIINH